MPTTSKPPLSITLSREQWAHIHDALVSYAFLSNRAEKAGVKVPSYMLQTADEEAAGDELIAIIQANYAHVLPLSEEGHIHA